MVLINFFLFFKYNELATTLSITEGIPADRSQFSTEADVCMASGGKEKAHHAAFPVISVLESCDVAYFMSCKMYKTLVTPGNWTLVMPAICKENKLQNESPAAQ